MDHHLLSQLMDLFRQQSTLELDYIANYFSVEQQVVVQWLDSLNKFSDFIKMDGVEKISLNRPCDLLNQEKIRHRLPANILQEIGELEIHTSLTSTNENLKKKVYFGSNILICLAEHQSNGRGRRDRQWISPFGQNIYLSLLIRCQIPANSLGMISLVTGIAVAEALQEIGIGQLKVKWPNDIYWQNQKLAGILIEVKELKEVHADLVIGIGLNVNMDDMNAISIEQSWTSLNRISDVLICRSHIAAQLIKQVMGNINLFERNGFDAFVPKWKEFDYLFGKQVNISGVATEIAGRACGINEQGELLVVAKGKTVPVRAGEVSVRLDRHGES